MGQGGGDFARTIRESKMTNFTPEEEKRLKKLKAQKKAMGKKFPTERRDELEGLEKQKADAKNNE